MATPKNRTVKDNADHAAEDTVTVAPDNDAPTPLDFATLVVADVAPKDMPSVTRNRKSKYGPDHPVIKWLADSYQAGSAKSVTVPDHAAKALVSTLRGAAAAVNKGVKIIVQENGDGTTRVVFAAKDKRAYKSRNTSAE